MAKGKIGVTTENIFPVIKKFLYSDHEIFLRELVSNAIDATQKLKTLASFGEFKGELGELEAGPGPLDHRPLRSGLLFGLHGLEEGRDPLAFL